MSFLLWYLLQVRDGKYFLGVVFVYMEVGAQVQNCFC